MDICERCYRNAEERVNNVAWEFTESYTESVRFGFSQEDMKVTGICVGSQSRGG